LILKKNFARAKATSYQPVFEAHIDFEKELCQSKSYQLPYNFQSVLVFVSIARTAATSYHPVFKEQTNFKICAKIKATSYH
jgi:hypothetical protein